MKKFWLILKAHFQIRLEYRVDMVFYSISSILNPIIGLALWLTASNYTNLPFSKLELIAYFIAAIYIGIAAEMWQSWYIAEDINNGHFSTLLIKPIPLIGRYLAELFSDKLFKIIVITFSLPIIFVLIPKNVWQVFSITPVSLSLFALTLALGFMILFFIEISIGLATVWFHDVDFLKGLFDLANQIFSGRFIPLIFFPANLASVAFFLPFKYSVSFPIEILLNKLKVEQLLNGLIAEFIWLLLSILIYKAILFKFKDSYQGYGL